MFRRPPALADWLLDRLGYTRQNTALAGDLLEEFRDGRSAGWYWRQTLAVIADGIPRNLASLAPYLLAVTVGYLVQLPLSYALWSHGLPPVMPGSAWLKYVLMQVAAFFGVHVLVKWKLGKWHVNVRSMFRAAGNDRQQRSTALVLACYSSFSLGLWNYLICEVALIRFTQAQFVYYQSIWFALWAFAPTVLSALAVPAGPRTAPVENREPWLAIPQREPILTVALPDGRAILLERDRLAESIFGAADPELIRVAFGSGKSLDLLRRAVWFGGYQSKSHIPNHAESLTVAELAALIRQISKVAHVETADYDSNRRASRWDRLNRAFRGDPV